MDFLFLRLGATYVPGAAPTGGGILPRPHWLSDAKVPLTGLSLWCAYGTTATQLAEKFANQAVASTAQSSKKTTLDRLRKQRDALTFTETSAEAVKTAQGAVSTAAALSHAVFAISIELGSGVGFWLVFGHGAPGRRFGARFPAYRLDFQ